MDVYADAGVLVMPQPIEKYKHTQPSDLVKYMKVYHQ